MNIGIYSLPFHSNYGGLLQSYALQTTLERFGHTVYVFNRNWLDRPGKKDQLRKVLYAVTNLFSKHKRNTQLETLKRNIHELHRFWTTEVHTCDFWDFKELLEYKLDAIVVGSDQVWRKGYCKDTRWYFLDFARDWKIKRIAYAASFGIDEWVFDTGTTADIKELIQQFESVSVRESDGVNLCKTHLGVDALQVLDPTLLLTREDYMRFRTHVECNSRKRFLSFMLHPSQQKTVLAKKLAESLDADYVSVDIPMADVADQTYLGIETWLTEFLDADYILTDSYHGTVFAINFNVPFMTLGNLQGGQSRFSSLLNLFNLQDRMSTNESEILSCFNKDINWNSVNEQLAKYRSISTNFILESLR